jgi:hypothetical protein
VGGFSTLRYVKYENLLDNKKRAKVEPVHEKMEGKNSLNCPFKVLYELFHEGIVLTPR